MILSRLSIASLLMFMLVVLSMADHEQQYANWSDPQNSSRSGMSSAWRQYPNRPLPKLKHVAEWFARPIDASQRWSQESNSCSSGRVTSELSPTGAFGGPVETDFCRFNPELTKDAIQTTIRLEANVSSKTPEQFEMLIAQPFPEAKSSGDYSWGPWILNGTLSPSAN